MKSVHEKGECTVQKKLFFFKNQKVSAWVKPSVYGAKAKSGTRKKNSTILTFDDRASVR